MYKVCYVLTDDKKKRYYNEFMISVSSLRYQGFKGPVILVIDRPTSIILRDHKSEIADYGIETITVDVPNKYSPMESSRYLKTCLREVVKGDYLYVDTDTIFAQNLPECISKEDIALVSDCHIDVLEKGSIVYNCIKSLFEKIGVLEIEGNTYFNNGVMWVKDNEQTHLICSEWHKKWLECMEKGIPYDQPAFNLVDWKLGHVIRKLDETFNVQVAACTEIIDFALVSQAYIIHYFNVESNCPYLLTKKEIREQPYKSDIIQKIIQSPKSAFAKVRIVRIEEATILDTRCYAAIKLLYRKYKCLFEILEKCLGLISKLKNKIKEKI